MRIQARWWLVPWLLLAATAQVVGFEVVRRVFVDTAAGQRLDTAALAGNTIGWRHIDELVSLVLGAMTVVSLLVVTAAIGFIALMRRQLMVALLATALIAGANLTTQVIKATLHRPEFGIDLARAAAGNSLPSGHTTVAASVAVALALVLPGRLRAVAAVLGAGYAALVGVATLAAGWHRPSDAVAALLIVGAWAAAVGLVLALRYQPAPGPVTGFDRLCRLGLCGMGVVLVAAALAAMVATEQSLAAFGDGGLGRRQLFTAYAGGAAGIAGVTCLVVGAVLATAHLVLPQRPGDSDEPIRAGAGR